MGKLHDTFEPPAHLAKVRPADRSGRTTSDRRARLWVQRSFVWLFVCLIVATAIAILRANNGAIIDGYFNGAVLRASLPSVARAFTSNLWISVVVEITALCWGLLLAMARGLSGRTAAPLRFLAILYIDLLRGLPSLLTILLIGFGLPQTGLPIVSRLGVAASGELALTAIYGAYLAETLRAGIESVHWGQIDAGEAVGLSYFQIMRFVVVPQALHKLIPPLMNWYISLLKDTSLLSVLGLLEGVNKARILVIAEANLSALTGVAICFLVVTIPLARFTDYLIRRNTAKLRGTA